MKVLIAPNAFKSSLGASAAADAIARGLCDSGLQCDCRTFPIGDGGDGTGPLLVSHLKGVMIPVTVHDPLGRRRRASVGWVEDARTAVIELADASGLRLLAPKERDPIAASTFGTGELMLSALDLGAREILLCVGGSATVDGGTGLLQALGARFRDHRGQVLERIPEDLETLEAIDVSHLDDRLQSTAITVLCDVDAPLLGAHGAAAVFGPQKGATPSMIGKLDARLARLADAIARTRMRDISLIPHGGAAGGVAGGLYGALNARLANGIDDFLDRTGFDRALSDADLVITGEGGLDEQTLAGKAPFGVALRAKRRGLPVIALAGQVPDVPSPELRRFFDCMLAIGDRPRPPTDALRRTERNLIRTSRELGALLALGRRVTS